MNEAGEMLDEDQAQYDSEGESEGDSEGYGEREDYDERQPPAGGETEGQGASHREASPIRRMAECALAFELRMRTLPGDIDPSWEREFVEASPALRLPFAQSESRPAPLVGALRRFCGEAPPLERLTAEAARIALQRRPMVLRALCLLALSRRPGVLRCCIDRGQREMLQQFIGDALPAMQAMSAGGRPVSHEATLWTPLHWSCVGYLDWLNLLPKEDVFLRRLVRLMLPRGLLDMPRRLHQPRSDFTAVDAVARLQTAGVQWPC